jgi:hypothetical protein
MSTQYMLAENLWEAIKSDHGYPFLGIYRLHVLDEGGEFEPLPRMLGVDPLGVLYIGAAASISDRASALKISVSAAYRKIDPKTYAHLKYIDVDAHQAGKKTSIFRVSSSAFRLTGCV